jgi:hypothetical protein
MMLPLTGTFFRALAMLAVHERLLLNLLAMVLPISGTLFRAIGMLAAHKRL